MKLTKLSSPVFTYINGESVQILSLSSQESKALVLKVIKHTELTVDYDPSWYDKVTTDLSSLHNISNEEKYKARDIMFEAISRDVSYGEPV